MKVAILLALSLVHAAAQEPEPVYKFGTTVVLPTGLKGTIYNIHPGTEWLPDFRKLKPVGTIYTSTLNIPTQNFSQGFPGVTKRFEWFALDYTGRFWAAHPGVYRFSLVSDDGSKLYIDDALVIENDGVHATRQQDGEVELATGIHRMRVSYFQGPKMEVALVLRVAAPGETDFRIFSTDEFKPPPDAQWADPVEEPKGKTRKKRL